MDSASIGFVRFVDTDEGIEVSVCLHPKFRRFGYSEKMLYLAIRERGDITKMYSTIKICNEPSYRTFATTCRFLKGGLVPP
jgi:hypothetical protein